MPVRYHLINLTLAPILLAGCSHLSVPEDKLTEPKDVIGVHESLGLIRNIGLIIDDQVTGKCWTNVNQIKQKTKVALEQSGIRVYGEELASISPFSTNLKINGLGGRSSAESCFGSMTIYTLKALEHDWKVQIEYAASNFTRSAVIKGYRSLNNQFMSYSEEVVSEFIADIIKGRRDPIVAKLLSENPDKRPLTTD